jgi:hypothetical protein
MNRILLFVNTRQELLVLVDAGVLARDKGRVAVAHLDDLRPGRMQQSQRRQAGRLCQSPEFVGA